MTCKLKIRMKVIPSNTQRNWGDTWTLQRSLWRIWSVLSSDKDVQHRVAACSVCTRNFKWQTHEKNTDGNNPAWVCEGWGPISEEFRTLRKEKQKCLGYRPDEVSFGPRFSGQRRPGVPRHRSMLVLRTTHTRICRVSQTLFTGVKWPNREVGTLLVRPVKTGCSYTSKRWCRLTACCCVSEFPCMGKNLMNSRGRPRVS